MKIIIADDERLARANIRSMLEELELPLQIVGEAKDGAELVELIAMDQPDIVFVDIRMPIMDGFKAIRNAVCYEYIQWVIISGYSDFSYAQQAIKLQVADYLLKPVDPDPLGKCLNSLLEKQRKKTAILNRELERRIMSVLYLSRSEDELNDASQSIHRNYSAYVLKVDDHLPPHESHQRFQGMMDEIDKLEGDWELSMDVRRAILIMPSGEAVVIFALQEANTQILHKLIQKYTLEMERVAEHHRRPGFSVHIERLAHSISFKELVQRLRLAQDKAEEQLGAVLSAEDHGPPDLIQRTVQYIDRWYTEDIGIGQIANELGVTPNYLSSLFHRKQGVTFMKYLTSTRMNKAKEILQDDPQIRISQVAQQVGYYSTRHFTRLFVEYFQCYPSELRDQSQQTKS